jgi:hypothetical protein
MPTIQTRCPACRQRIDLAGGECALLEGVDGGPAAYAFVCPRCGEPVVRRTDRQAAALLVAGGASARGAEERVPRPAHPETPSPGPAFTVDDCIDLHLLLFEDRSWFDGLTGLADRPEPPGGP